jgi:3-oxoacyl-[acyl-carrier-protein] synthase II
VVTGYGAISALGIGATALRQGIREDRSALRTITRFDASDQSTQFAAEVPDFVPGDWLDRKASRRMDRFTQFAAVTAREAVTMAGLDVRLSPERVGVVTGSAFGGVETFTATVGTLLERGPKRISPFAVPMSIANMAPGVIAIDLGAKGPAFAYASAFASGANAIGEGMRMIRQGRVDAVVAGGAEAPIHPLILAGFAAMQSLSERNDDPGSAVKPFDLYRDGCALGEGAAMLVLEDRDHAIARGATIIAELAGYGATSDAFHVVQLAPEGEGIARAMVLAMTDARMEPAAVGYVNAHGTGTTMNDAYETTAIHTAFGPAAKHLAISSTKSRTGHLLGAAGALEAVISVQALEDGVLPSTLNLATPDPACDLDYLPGASRSQLVQAVMSNSMGFGGHNVSLLFRQANP